MVIVFAYMLVCTYEGGRYSGWVNSILRAEHNNMGICFNIVCTPRYLSPSFLWTDFVFLICPQIFLRTRSKIGENPHVRRVGFFNGTLAIKPNGYVNYFFLYSIYHFWHLTLRKVMCTGLPTRSHSCPPFWLFAPSIGFKLGLGFLALAPAHPRATFAPTLNGLQLLGDWRGGGGFSGRPTIFNKRIGFFFQFNQKKDFNLSFFTVRKQKGSRIDPTIVQVRVFQKRKNGFFPWCWGG